MRAKRILLISLAAAAVLAAAMTGAAFIPGVQTWLGRAALASTLHRGVSVESVAFGPNRVELRGLRIERGGAVLVVPSADAELGVFSAFFGRGYLVRNLVARGWTLDLNASGQPRTAVSPAQSRGSEFAGSWAARAAGAVLAAFNVPSRLSLEGADLEGVVILPYNGARPVGNARVIFTGGGLAAGREGHFLCDAVATVDDPAAPVSSIAVHATLAAAMDPSGTLTRADAKADATASGRKFPSGISLSGTASAERGSGKTAYSFALTRGSERIAWVDADSPDASTRLDGSWALNLRDTDLAPFALGRELPSFTVAGSGTYDLDAASGDLHAAGKVNASADRLGVVAAALAPLGPVGLNADFDMARSGESLRVDRLEASVSGAAPVASVRALQTFEFNVQTGVLKVASPSGDLVGISVAGIPLSWLRGPFPEFEAEGSDARGEFVMRAEEGRLALRTRAPLVSTGVSLSRGGRRLAEDLDVSSFLLGDYSPEGWQVQLAPLSMRSAGIRVISLEARIGRLAGAAEDVKAAGSWSASLDGWAAQPAGAWLPRLAGGEASGSFEASLGQRRELRVKVALKDLRLASGSDEVLPDITSDLRADLDPDGGITFNIPLLLAYGNRTANLVYSGTVGTAEAGRHVAATLSAESLTEDDFFMIAALCGGGTAAGLVERGVAAGPSAAAAARSWPVAGARVAFVIEHLAVRGIDLRNVRGTLVVGASALRIESGMAGFGDACAMRFGGELRRGLGSARPLALSATVSADNIDSTALFRSLNPNKPPEIEGRFDLLCHLNGTGADLRELKDTLQGDCRISSKDGKFRALRTDALESLKQAPSAIIDAVDTVTSLFGRKPDKTGEALVDAANGLSEIHYDQLNLSAVRGPDLDIVLTEIALLAPEERITGTGRISHVDGEALDEQPLAVDLDMGVRGALGKVLAVLGLLKDGHDELGYTQLYQSIHLGGTLRDIDQSQWREMLIQGPLRKGGRLFDKLLGR